MNAANVMPIIFAQAIMFIPVTVARFSVKEGGGFWASLMDFTSFWYNLIFALLIIAFTYFYTAVTVNPVQMAEDLKRNNGFIPGVKPGKRTAEYIDTIMSRITLPEMCIRDSFTFSAMVVVGNEDGIVGWGLGKAGEVTTAIAKGVEAAKKNLIEVPVYKGTIPHEQTARFGGAEVFLKPAVTGTGVKAGGAMRAVLESVGVTDILAKSKGSSNPHNLVKATITALSELRDPIMVARARGVSIDKVFNG